MSQWDYKARVSGLILLGVLALSSASGVNERTRVKCQGFYEVESTETNSFNRIIQCDCEFKVRIRPGVNVLLSKGMPGTGNKVMQGIQLKCVQHFYTVKKKNSSKK